MKIDLTRYLQAQENDFILALAEVRAGRKRSHWMWYIFPQISGLGQSETAQYYAIQNLEEARAYLAHPLLGCRLVEISQALLRLESNDARRVFGSPDDLKLRSCMTLFALADGTPENIFLKVIEKYFNGVKEEWALTILQINQ